MSEKYCIFHANGGLGKSVAATAVAKCIKNNHPDRKLIVTTGWPEVFMNLNFVDRVYRLGQFPYFYDDYIKDKDCLIFSHDPYYSTDHILGRKDLIESWCNTYNLKYENERPELIFNLRHKQMAHELWPPTKKPVLLMHAHGGPTNNDSAYRWDRDMPYCIINSVIEEFKKDYDIFYVSRENMYKPKDVFVVDKTFSPMHLFTILARSQKRLLIDSSLQHAAAAMNLSSTVLWIGTKPSMFGYSIHNNIVANKNEKFKNYNSYFAETELGAIADDCPYEDETEIFNIDEIITALRK